MRFHRIIFLLLLSVLFMPMTASAQAHRFNVADGKFQLDGKPIQIISGEIHYARIPRERWVHDLQMTKAMGMNAITVYTFWNVHEPTPGHFDFSGNADVAEFVREAQRQGLFVILRPGPYSCAEWDFGGFPAWLEKDSSVRLRTTDPKFMTPAAVWFKRLAKELAPLQIANGGPIIAVQVENEYGSYGSDREYMKAVRQAILDAGFNKTLLYSTDGGKHIEKDILPDMLSAVNFGPGKVGVDDPDFAPRKEIAMLQKLRPNDPVLVGEYWDGWFDHWGSKWEHRNGAQQALELEWMLKQGYSVSLYMQVGGTSFGWMNGANSPKENSYEPDVNSYDYDAAMQEDGSPSKKYFLFRDAIQRATGKTPPSVPDSPASVAMPAVPLTRSVSLWKTLPAPHKSEHPLTMEDLDQDYGYILYRTTVDGPMSGELELQALHGYADVYVDGKFAGSMDRRLQERKLNLDIQSPHAQLDILVENTGRINFGPRLQGERIGILGDVYLAGKTLAGWNIYTLPMKAPQNLKFGTTACEGPCFYRGTLHVDKPAATYIDTRELRKGMLWVNGRAVGRFWFIGPQGSLYLPASWLHSGENDIVIFDLDAKPGRSVRGIPNLITDFGGEEHAQ